MFSAQVDGQRGSPRGMNTPVAAQKSAAPPQPHALALPAFSMPRPSGRSRSGDGVARQPFPRGRRSLNQPFHVKQLTGPPAKRPAL